MIRGTRSVLGALVPLALLALLGGGAVPPGVASSAPRVLHDTGERFRTPLLGREFRILADEEGALALVDGDGRTFDSAEAAVLAEEAGLPPVRRVVHPELWPLLDDPARAAEVVRVVLVLRRQPVRDASLAARGRVRPLVEARLARLRSVLAEIAPLRSPDPERLLQLGDRVEEEARLLSPEARPEMRELREEIRDLVRGMRREILDAARPLCALDQAPVVARVGAEPGGRVLASSFVLSAVVAEVPAGSLGGLASDLPSLARILPHGVRKPVLDTSVATLGATTWIGAGLDGASTKVSVMDTGIDASHPALSAIMGAQSVHLAVGAGDPTFQDDASSTDDIYGHGSHVGGIVMSQDASYKGVAPGGVLLNAKCGYNSSQGGNLQDGDIMAAGDWSVDNGADAVNASFGGGGTTDGSSDLSLWFDALVAGPGVFAAVAAGNSGPSAGTVGTPGDAFNIVTVGSLDDKGTTAHSDNAISSFSSRGPLDDGRRKPDLCAPGSNIMSCNYRWETAADFVSYNGTSMATPHIAGAAALLLDFAASWRPEGIKALLLSTTRNTSPYPATPDSNWGWGAADMAAAYTSRGTVREGTLTATGSRVAFFQMPTLAAGKRATLCWNRDVSWNGASVPASYRALANLDLTVYEEASQAVVGTSASAINSVEQAAVSATTTFPLLKVKLKGTFPSGQSVVDFAVASEGAGSGIPARAPDLACTITLGKAAASPADVFTVDVTLADNGDLPAFAPTVTLSLPPGYALDSGTLEQSLQDIAAGASRTATWTVVAGGSVTGTATFGAFGKCRSYEEDFTGPTATKGQPFDASGPTGAISVQGGAAAVPSTVVGVQVYATDDSTGVAEMRVRNDGGAWGAWQPFAPSFPWTLPSGEGSHAVEVQLKDGAGNLSGILSDSVLLDTTPPEGTFVLSGDAAYLMPFEALVADVAGGDGTGSGVAGFRVRWGAGSPWSEWIPAGGDGPVPLARPPAEKNVRAEGQFRDAAGNVSASSFDAVHLVPADPPSLAEVKSFAGTLAANGDIDAFVVGALPGDVLSVRVKSAPAAKGAEFLVDADLFDPSGAKVATGRYPEGARKPGIAKFAATLPGRHWIVLRPAGADAAAGGRYVLSVKAAAAKANRRIYIPGDPVDGAADFPFHASEGTTASGVVRGPVTGPITLEGPDGSVVPVATEALAPGGVKVPGLRFAASGACVLHVPASGPLLVDLKVRPPRRGKAVETGD